MFRYKIVLIVLLLLLAVSAAGNDRSDDSLNQIITYSPGRQIRLHEIAEDISKLTGLTIKCGRNDYDWQTRDFPMAISVKNMNLHRFLILLAESANVKFGLDESTFDKKPRDKIYRLYRTYENEKIEQTEKNSNVIGNGKYSAISFGTSPIVGGYFFDSFGRDGVGAGSNLLPGDFRNNKNELSNMNIYITNHPLFPALYKPDSKPKIYAKHIQAISQQCKINIISVDLFSNSIDDYYNMELIKRNIANLNAPQAVFNLGYNDLHYSIEDNAIYSCHSHTLPIISEKDEMYLKDRICKNQFGFEDAMILANMTRRNSKIFIGNAKILEPLFKLEFCPEKIWRFYASLSTNDKDKAQTNEGLKISSFDLNLMSKYLDFNKWSNWNMYEHQYYADKKEDIEFLKSLSNKEVLKTAMITVIKEPASHRDYLDFTYDDRIGKYLFTYRTEPTPTSKDRFTHKLRITAIINGEKKFVDCPIIGATFPIKVPDGVVITYKNETQK